MGVTIARYRELIERTAYDLKLAQDAARALNLPYKQIARLQRAQRELRDEQQEISDANGNESGQQVKG
jgi:hypothetical protein